jgi:hypothetical protein
MRKASTARPFALTPPDFDPDLVPLIDAVIPERTVLMALLMDVEGAATGAAGAADVEFCEDGVVGDAHADTRARAHIDTAKLAIFFIPDRRPDHDNSFAA